MAMMAMKTSASLGVSHSIAVGALLVYDVAKHPSYDNVERCDVVTCDVVTCDV
jgi:hypothetical protein